MSQRIGMFTAEKDGILAGSIKTLSIATAAKFVPVEQTAKGPAFRIYAGLAEIGAAWKKTVVDTGKPYHSVKLDSPELAEPINAALFELEDKPGTFNLVWDRPRKQDERQPGQEG